VAIASGRDDGLSWENAQARTRSKSSEMGRAGPSSQVLVRQGERGLIQGRRNSTYTIKAGRAGRGEIPQVIAVVVATMSW